jgi:hypothetical protein
LEGNPGQPRSHAHVHRRRGKRADPSTPHRQSASLQLRIGSASTGARVSSRTGVGSGRKRIQRAIGHRKRRRLHLTACFNGENRRDRRSRERRVPSIVSHFARDALFSPNTPRGLPSRHERELRGVRPGATRR